MTEHSGPDRRMWPRIESDSLVSIERMDGKQWMGTPTDLSEGGIRFQCTGVDLEPGEFVRVTLMNGSEKVSVVGTLERISDVDANSQEFAVVFLDSPNVIRELQQSGGLKKKP